MSKSVFSKAFMEKLRAFAPARRADVLKAVDRVMADPTLNGYTRWYLDPYRQEHPSDKTLTIFFVIPAKPSGRVFFVWVNDDNHPHNTRQNFGDDPCVKEFARLRDATPSLLELYDEDEHEGKLTVKPRATTPVYVTLEKNKVAVLANVTNDGTTNYTSGIVSMAHPRDLFDHYRVFIEKLRGHFIKIAQPFEFRVLPGDNDFQNLLTANTEPAQWNRTQDSGMEIWLMR
jgi:hypothetical protein